MNVTVTVDDKIIENAITGARIKYWAKSATFLCMTLSVVEDDGDIEHIAMASGFAKAIGIMATNHPKAFTALVSGHADSVVGDLLIQLAVFGEAKYG